MGMDFIGPLKKTFAGNEFILHTMDYFARLSTAEAPPTADIQDVIKFLTRVFDIYFTPEALYLDRGQHFENDELTSFLKDRGVAEDFSPSGSSKSTGMIELENRILEGVIRKGTTEWDLGPSNSGKEVNVRVVDHLLHSPRGIVMGVPTNALRAARLSVADPSTIGPWVEFLNGKEAHRDSVQRFLEWKWCIRDEVSRLSKEKKAKEKLRYDRGATAVVRQLSSLVMLHQKNTGKLEPRWRGPFRLRGYGGKHYTSCTLEHLNSHRKIRGSFHGDDLKLFVPRTGYLRFPTEETLLNYQTIRAPRSRRRVHMV